MTWHDDRCEWFTSRTDKCRTCSMVGGASLRHCHCGSRAYALCDGCKRGMHVDHTVVAWVFSTNRPCQCDLCAEPSEGTAA